MNMKLFRNWSCTVLLGLALWMPTGVLAEKVEENPGGFRMATDLIVARPIGLVLFGLGTATFIVTLPFSLLGGNVEDAGGQLVVEPAREVFVRCLGCSKAGRKEKIGE